MVFVAHGPTRFKLHDVKIGESSHDYTEIRAGVQEGDEVVTQGSYTLKSEALREQMPEGGPL